jgi:hypothetical protein
MTAATPEPPDRGELTLYEAEASAVLRRADGHATALGAALDEAASVLAMARREDLSRALDRLRELERIVAVRVHALARRVAEGEP